MAPARETPPETEATRKMRGVGNPFLAERNTRVEPIDFLNTTNYLFDDNNVPAATVEQVYWTEDEKGRALPIKATKAVDGSYDLSGGFMRRIGGNEQPAPRPLKYLWVKEFALIIETDTDTVNAACNNKVLESEKLASDDGKRRIPVIAAKAYICTRIAPSMQAGALYRLEQVVSGNVSRVEDHPQ